MHQQFQAVSQIIIQPLCVEYDNIYITAMATKSTASILELISNVFNRKQTTEKQK